MVVVCLSTKHVDMDGVIRAVEAIRYMLELYPESINARDSKGLLPIHNVVQSGKKSMGKKTLIIELLLEHDPDAASEKDDISGQYPLHMVCSNDAGRLSEVKVLYDAFPDAIHLLDENGATALLLARNRGYYPISRFLTDQHVFARQARDTKEMTTLDENGLLPLHRALLQGDVPLGSIKLLLKGNPSAIQTVDNNLAFPFHTACEFSSVEVVLFLAGNVGRSDILEHLDKNEDSVVHYACRGGNLEVVKYLLGNHASLVASATLNKKGELPIHLLCEAGIGKVDHEDYLENSIGKTRSSCVGVMWYSLYRMSNEG